MKKPRQLNWFDRTKQRFDLWQQKHRFTALPYAVVKKYSDDEAGYQAALITYYGFLSLFPLLIVATAVIQAVSQRNDTMREQFITSVNSYFPAIGQSLTDSINTPTKTGVALVVALLIAFYGARGVAQAVQHALNHAWAVPRHKRAGFPWSLLRSLAMIVLAGTGLIIAASFTGWATSGSHEWWLRFTLWLTGFTFLFSVFWGVFTFGSSARKRPFSNIPGAFVASIGILLLQAVGSYIITRQLTTFTGLYAQFAIVLVIMFWMYLQAQILLYSIELITVRSLRLWPRSLDNSPPTLADHRAYELYRERETFHDDKPVGH